MVYWYFLLRILGRGQMFIFSREQLQRIVPPLSSAPSPLLIDIGAGDGNVTDVLKSVFSPSVVCVTETSGVMKRVLARKGYRCVITPFTLQDSCVEKNTLSCDKCDNTHVRITLSGRNRNYHNLGRIFGVETILYMQTN